MQTVRPDFPAVFDSTMLSTARSCFRKFEIEFLHHYRSENVNLVAGKAFAKGVEVARRSYFLDKQSEADSIAAGIHALLVQYGSFDPPVGHAKTAERMMGALAFYFDRYPLHDQKFAPELLGDKHAIEFSFANPLSVRHPVTGDPLLFSGRADMIARYGAAGLFLFDEKTTTQLGASWPRQWDLRGQFTGYTWGAREWGLDVKGAVIRGVSILKNSYDTAECITYRSPWQIELWLKQTLRTINQLIDCWKEGFFDYNFADSCSSYGGCQFRSACLSRPEAAESWLSTSFQKRPWNPLEPHDA